MKVKIQVEGMTCGSCELTVSRAITEVMDVHELLVSHAENMVQFSTGSEQNLRKAIDAVRNKGYKVISWENSAN